MAILSWGKPKIKFAKSEDKAPNGSWTQIPTPKQDTTKITTTKGEKKEALEEGGGVVDVRYTAGKATLEFEVYQKKGESPWVADNDGIIEGEYAFKIIPEDKDCEGVQIDCARGTVETNYSSADGILHKYTFEVLKPKTGKSLKISKVEDD